MAIITGVAAYTVYSAGMSWPWIVLALLIHGSVVSNLNAGVHELIHERVFKTRWPNLFFLGLISFTNWWNYRFFQLSHNEHHKYTLHQPDDLEVVLPQNITIFNFISNTIVDFWTPIRKIKENLLFSFGILSGDWEKYIVSRENKKTQQWVFNWSRFLLLGHGLIIAVSLYYGNWMVPLLVSFGRFYGGGLALLMGATQHIGLVDKVNDFRLCCRTVKFNPLFEFLYWRMNYHTEHHMYPAVPCYNLPKLHKAIKHELPHTTKGIFETWAHIVHILYRQKWDPGYQYRAPLPTDKPEDLLRPVEKKEPVQTYTAKVWECKLCGFIYDEKEGLPEEGIAPGTAWKDIPADWLCPVCGVKKSQFHMVEITREVATTKGGASGNIDAHGDPIVIIGSGIAGYSIAREIRSHEPHQKITIITRDKGENYYKPNLSTALQKDQSADALVLSDAAKMAKQLKLTVLNETEVSRIDPESKKIQMGSDEISYHKLVLATGADQFRLPIKGDAASQIITVNDLEDFRKYREALPEKGSVLIIGAGLIGCEFANDLALKNYEVGVLDLAPTPLGRLLPEAMGRKLQDELGKIGVNWNLGTSLQAVHRGENKAYRCELTDGSSLEVDLILSAVGLRPRIQLAKEAGLEVNKGIVVNATLQTTNEHIFAIGDCLEFEGQLLPYVAPILHETKALGRTLSGNETPVQFPTMPVVVKTTSCPLTIAPPKAGEEGSWTVTGEGRDLKGSFHNTVGDLVGAAFLGATTEEADQFTPMTKAELPKPAATA